MGEKKRVRAASGVWRNDEYRFKKERCVGTYKVYHGKRMFILIDKNNSDARHRFDSHEAAKDRSWYKEGSKFHQHLMQLKKYRAGKKK